MSTIEAFFWAGKRRPAAAQIWLNRLASISTQGIQYLFERIPTSRISMVTITFALKLLELNQQRLLALSKELR